MRPHKICPRRTKRFLLIIFEMCAYLGSFVAKHQLDKLGNTFIVHSSSLVNLFPEIPWIKPFCPEEHFNVTIVHFIIKRTTDYSRLKMHCNRWKIIWAWIIKASNLRNINYDIKIFYFCPSKYRFIDIFWNPSKNRKFMSRFLFRKMLHNMLRS